MIYLNHGATFISDDLVSLEQLPQTRVKQGFSDEQWRPFPCRPRPRRLLPSSRRIPLLPLKMLPLEVSFFQ